jgi:hypothetical protein
METKVVPSAVRICLLGELLAELMGTMSVMAAYLLTRFPYSQAKKLTNARERERVLANLFKHLPHLTPVESKMNKGTSQTIVFRLRVHKITGMYEKW